MAIYAVGAFYSGTTDVSPDFIQASVVGVGWSVQDAPELHQFMRSLKVGDVVYIKACAFGADKVTVKAVGLIKDDVILDSQSTGGLVEIGRNVIWKSTNTFTIPNPSHTSNNQSEKLNHRSNTIYEEFHPFVQTQILSKL
jgi:hypothetical protein